jgi:hypothetical protein
MFRAHGIKIGEVFTSARGSVLKVTMNYMPVFGKG